MEPNLSFVENTVDQFQQGSDKPSDQNQPFVPPDWEYMFTTRMWQVIRIQIVDRSVTLFIQHEKG